MLNSRRKGTHGRPNFSAAHTEAYASQELHAAQERLQKQQLARQENIRRLEARVFDLKEKLLQSKGSLDSVMLLQSNITELKNSNLSLEQVMQVNTDLFQTINHHVECSLMVCFIAGSWEKA